MNNRDFNALRKAWKNAAKQYGDPQDCLAATVAEMESDKHLGATGKALVEILKLAQKKKQVLCCLGCKFAILPNEPIRVLEQAVEGTIHCYNRSPLTDGLYACNLCRHFKRREAYLTEADYEKMRRTIL